MGRNGTTTHHNSTKHKHRKPTSSPTSRGVAEKSSVATTTTTTAPTVVNYTAVIGKWGACEGCMRTREVECVVQNNKTKVVESQWCELPPASEPCCAPSSCPTALPTSRRWPQPDQLVGQPGVYLGVLGVVALAIVALLWLRVRRGHKPRVAYTKLAQTEHHNPFVALNRRHRGDDNDDDLDDEYGIRMSSL